MSQINITIRYIHLSWLALGQKTLSLHLLSVSQIVLSISCSVILNTYSCNVIQKHLLMQCMIRFIESFLKFSVFFYRADLRIFITEIINRPNLRKFKETPWVFLSVPLPTLGLHCLSVKHFIWSNEAEQYVLSLEFSKACHHD